MPRALGEDELPGIVADFAQAAGLAREAGFDGVEIHGANGYLLDQFMKDGANQRTDRYGGSIENRLRLTLEVVEAVSNVWGAGRVGIRLSPVTPANGISESDPQAVFTTLAERLSRHGLAFIHVIEGATGGTRDHGSFDYLALKQAFSGPYIGNNGYTGELAAEAVRSGRADAVAFGRPFIANPDLVDRIRVGGPWNAADSKTFYGGDERGYLDYPTLQPAQAA